MAKLALYRKYRGSTFAEVLGQDQVVATLERAVASGHVGHAYLLAGPRGTGKTSVARILARSLNCTAGTKPCGKCPNCLAAIAGGFDVVEIDAASNRGIDEIRELRDKINLAPALGRYRIYIIDEAHMLTEAAFNALLKTLEEPPSHVVFILATTEAHKLPATVISRTQRFNFKPLSTGELTGLVTKVAGLESITLDPAASQLIAQLGGGSARDALGLLDQISTLEEPIDEALVRRFLGLGDLAQLSELTAAIVAGNSTEIVGHLSKLLGDGTEPTQLIGQLLRLWQSRLHQALTAGDRPATARLVAMTQAVMPVARSTWPALALEAALLSLGEPATAVPAQPDRQPQSDPAPPAVTKAPSPPTVAARPATGEAPTTLWPKALVAIKAQNNSLYALICSCEVIISTDRVELAARFNFHRDRLLEPKNRAIIETAIRQSLGSGYQLEVELAQAVSPAAVDSSGELVTSALEILGGEVVE